MTNPLNYSVRQRPAVSTNYIIVLCFKDIMSNAIIAIFDEMFRRN